VTLQSAPIHSALTHDWAEPIVSRDQPPNADWAELDHEEADHRARRWTVVWEILALLAITVIGAGLRFMWLDRPAIWGDEAATYARICGTYADLVDELHGWGFVPLHYQFYWWYRIWLLEHGRVLTPVLMRLPVATCNTLIIPAMYSLARQLLGRRAALVTALFTATSAYMLFYAHDAKMYSDSWLFCILEMSAFVWWMRRGTVMAWLAWIAAGAIAAGIHGPGLALLGIQPILLIAQRHHHWWKTILFLVGAGIIAAGPAYYYETFTKWGSNIQDQGWGASGLDWVNKYNATRDGPDLVRFTATAYLFAWEWPTVDIVDQIDPTVLKWCEYSSAAVLGLLVLGTFPWPTRLRYRRLAPPLLVFHDDPGWGITAGFWRLLNAGAPVGWWRSTVWLSVWIIVPTYGIYLVSVSLAESPLDWLHSARQWIVNPSNAAMAAAVAIPAFYCCAISFTGRIVRTLQLASVLLVPLLICTGLRELLKVQSPGSVWMPRYLGFIWPAVVMAGVVLLLRLPGVLRCGAIGLVVAMNVVNGLERMAQYTEPPMASIMSDLYAGRDLGGPLLVICDFDHGGASPGEQEAEGTPARYYILVDSKTQIHPRQFYTWDFAPHLDYPQDTDPAGVAASIADHPNAKRLIIWHVHQDKADPIDYGDALGKSWHRISAHRFHLWEYWNWDFEHWLDREEWVKQS
jgi:4-amino-4-deoxy-L-arabinose transferase-like glycosyltransferase